MALTRTQVSQLFVAIFNRASEGIGNEWWQQVSNNMEHAATEMLKTQDAKEYFGTSLDSNQAFVELIFKNTLNRTPADGVDVQTGISFWVNALNNGASRGFVVAEMVKAIQDYGPGGSKYNPADVGTMAAYHQFTNRVDVSNYLSLTQQDTLANYGTVTVFNNGGSSNSTGLTVTDAASTVASAQALIDSLPEKVFTLTEAVVEGTAAVAPVTKVYWGYTPDNNFPDDPQGIPVEELLKFLTTITGLNLYELGIVDDDGVGPYDSVDTFGDVSVKELSGLELVLDQMGPTAGGMLTINFADGSSKNAEVELGQQYVNFLQNLLYYTTYDVDGNPTLNSRLYEKVITPGTDATEATIVPIILTPATNNGGTIEKFIVTGNANDFIVAGRLELLHQAYIDAGYGYDVLEIDAKGVYAQPKQLLNIEEIRVHNMANVYTTDTTPGTPVWEVDGNGQLVLDEDGDRIQVVDEKGQPVFIMGGYLNNSTYPYLSGDGPISSFVDLSRATSIEKLVVNEAYDSIGGSGQTVPVGPLTIVGIRNDAVTRLEGGFTENVTLQYGQGLNGTLELELALGDVTADINLLQNAAVINIDSQGIENHMHVFFAGGSISRMNITGTGVFAVDENLGSQEIPNGDGPSTFRSSFNAGRPVIIDASTNTGGLDITLSDGSGAGDLGFSNVTVKGTQFDDEITVTNICAPGILCNAQVVIEAFNGNNTIDASGSDIVTITSGTGNDIILATDCVEVSIVAGDGKNVINTDGSETVDITTGTGNDSISSNGSETVTILSGAGNDAISVRNGMNVTIDAGDGNNTIEADFEYVIDDEGESGGAFGEGVVNITTGIGNDTISAVRHDVVTIVAGDGTNKITASANEISITTGAGNDTLFISGLDDEFDFGDQGDVLTAANNAENDDNYVDDDHFVDDSAVGALLTLNLGAGVNTINLGRDVTDEDVDAAVDNQYGITALEGSVITGTGIKLFVENHSDLTQADLTGATITSVVLKQELRITDNQFSAIGSSAFSVFRDEEGATEDLYVVIGQDGQESVTLSSLVNLATLNTNVRLHFELHNNSTLTLTAEQLHKYVSFEGIDCTDGLNGKVVITDAGQNFDPFDNGAANQVIDGGSLTDSFSASEDVTILRKLDGGYERPTTTPSTDTLILDSNVDAVIETAINSEVATLKIVGDVDMTFNHTVNLGRDTVAGPTATPPYLIGATLADGSIGDSTTATETDAYTIDFSALNGDVINLTLGNFQDVKAVKGNGSATRDVRINVELTNGSSVGAVGNNLGLNTSGVQTYVVTAIGDDSVGEDSAASSATFYVCDLSKDVTTLGLRGNYNDTINFEQVKWGTNFLLEAGGAAKADGNPSFANIGNLHADYFWSGAGPHAASVVTINNNGVALTKPINVASIDIDNADSITVNVADGDVIVNAFSGSSLNALTVVSANDVQLGIGENLLDGKIGNSGATTTSVINGTAVAGDFVLNMSGSNNFSNATLSGIDALNIVDNAVGGAQVIALTLSADQVVTLGAVINDTTTVDSSILNVNGFGTQAINFTAVDVDALGSVTFTDTGTSVIVDAGTVFGNAATAVSSLVIVANASDTTVEMTATQFNQLAGNGTVDGQTSPSASTGVEFVSKLVLTHLAANEVLNLSNVDAPGADGVSVVVRAENIVATNLFSITGHAVTLEAIGAVNLALATVPNTTMINAVNLAAGAVLTMTADQLVDIGLTDTNADGIADQWTGLAGSTLNITDLGSTQALRLDWIAAAGINIGTVSIVNSDAAVVLNAGTNLGAADSIITPTDAVDGVENTSLSLTAAQFNQLEGNGTITGGAVVNITSLLNNTDTNGLVPLTPDTAVINVTGITAPHGVMTLGQSTVTLDAVSVVTGFDIQLSTGQMIQFATAVQASGQMVTEIAGTTAIAWLFDNLGSLTVVDTSKYDGDINTMFILEDLVDGQNEENLWTVLNEGIHVQKTNVAGIPDVLIAVDRVNTFEALTAIAGVTYDATEEFQSIQTLTINLEGNTNIGNVVIGDSVGQVALTNVTINSYEDRSTLGAGDNSFTFQPNIVGNITINNTANANVVVTLNSFTNVDNIIGTGDDANGFLDEVNVSQVVSERDGLDLQVGIIKFAGEAGKTTTLDLNGVNNITIGGVDITDTDISLLDIDATGFTGPDADLIIGGIVPTGGVLADNALGSFGHIYVVDGYTAPAAAFGAAGNNLMVVSGTNDFTQATAFDVDKVHFIANSTLTLTAAQVATIGTADGVDTGTGADDWSMLASLNVTLNITELDGASVAMLLDKVAAQGINIGKITIKDTNAVVDISGVATTMGNADSIEVPAGTTLTLSALQFDQLEGTGTITGLTETGATQGKVNIANLVNTIDGTDVGTVVGDTASDYTTLNVTGITALHGTITLGAADVTVDAASILGTFSVTLNDINSTATPDEVAGQTIRFSNAVQAERVVVITGVDDNGSNDPGTPDLTQFSERDTNVIWKFSSIVGTATAGKINTSGYAAGLGRVWVNDALVNGQNIEDIFSSPSAILANPLTGTVNLNSSTIIRVVDTIALGTLDPTNLGVNRVVEVEAFTNLPLGLTFSNPDKLVGVENLSITLGGNVTLGTLTIDDIVAAPVANDNEFGTLTINSYSAGLNAAHDYLYPEGWVAGVNTVSTGGNVIGAISSGPTRGELARVTINPTDVALSTGTITFTDDGVTPDPTAVFTIGAGTAAVTVNGSLNTADVDITALTVNTTTYAGTLTVTGASPALLLDNTNTLTFQDDAATSTITLGTSGNAARPGIAGNELSFIDASTFAGTLNLGVIAQIDSTNDDSTPLTPANDGLLNAFTLTTGTGVTTATLATGDGRIPTLNAGSDWVFNLGNSATASALTITSDVVFGAGDLTINQGNADIIINGTVNLTNLTSLTHSTGGTGYIVLDGVSSILRITDELWAAGAGTTMNFSNVATADVNPTLHVTAALLASIGNDLTLVRGYSQYNIDFGLSLTLTPLQAATAKVYTTAANTTLGAFGALANANVTVDIDHYNGTTLSTNAVDLTNIGAVTLTGIYGLTFIDSKGVDGIAGTGDDTPVTVTLNVAQAGPLSIAADPSQGGVADKKANFIQVVDTQANIATLTLAQITAAKIDFVNVEPEDALTINVAFANAYDTANVVFNDAADTVTVVDTGANIGGVSAASLLGWNLVNINAINASDDVVAVNVAQANAIDTSDMVFDATDTATVVDTGAAIGAVLSNAFAGWDTANINAINVSDNAAAINVTQANAIDATTLVFDATDTITVTVASAEEAAVLAVAGPLAGYNLANINMLNLTDNAASVNVLQANAIGTSTLAFDATDTVTVEDTGANIGAVTAAGILAWNTSNINLINASDNAVAVNVAQANAIDTGNLVFDATDAVTVVDTGANIGAVLSAAFAGWNDANINTIDASDNAVAVNVTQANAIDTANLVFAASDTVTVVDTGANLGAVSVAAFGGWNDANINAINASDNAVTINVAQANAIDAADLVFDATDTATVFDTGANIGAVTAASIAGWDAANINNINAIDNTVALNVTQANAIDTANMVFDATDTVSVTIASGEEAAVLVAGTLNGYNAANINLLNLTDNAASVNVLTANAVGTSALIFDATDSVTIEDTGANVAAATVVNFNSWNVSNINAINVSDNAVTLNVGQADSVIAGDIMFDVTDVLSITDDFVLGSNAGLFTQANLGGAAGFIMLDDNFGDNPIISVIDAGGLANTVNGGRFVAGDAITVQGAFDQNVNYTLFTQINLGGQATMSLDDDDNAATLDIADAVNLDASNATFVVGDVLTVVGAFDNTVNYATYTQANLGGSAAITLNDSDNLVTIDIADALALDASAAKFEANDVITVADAFTAAVNYATFSQVNLGGNVLVTLNDNDDVAYIDGGDYLLMSANCDFHATDAIDITSTAGGEAFDFNSIGGADITLNINALADGGDVVLNFAAGAGNDIVDVNDIFAGALLNFVQATGATNFVADSNIIVFTDATGIVAAAAQIAADADIVATDGYIVIANGGNAAVYYTTSLAADGAETLLVTLTGVASSALVSGNFAF